MTVTLAATIFASVAGPAVAAQCRLDVRETAGIQRFGYPVAADFRVPNSANDPSRFRLRDGKRPMAAQFTLLADVARHDGGQESKEQSWAVDFSIDLLPLESRTLTLEYADEGAPPAPLKSGLFVERAGGEVRVAHPSLEFVVPEDLRGLLTAIRVRNDDFLGKGSSGLQMRLRDGRVIALVGSTAAGDDSPARIVKSGPLAVTLEFAGIEKIADGKEVRSQVRLDFPLGKSWIRVDWTVEDASDAVAGLDAEVRLRLDAAAKPPVLADVGACGWTYSALRPDEQLVYRARADRGTADSMPPAWQVDRVLAGKTTPYARPALSGDLPPQGWAHLMDGNRCTALAVDQFAAVADDTIALSAAGPVQLRRDFPPAPAGESREKRLAFWLHVVSVPPQVGAVTSPQSMQFPPQVRVGSWSP